MTKADTVKSYYDEKVSFLEKTGLSEEHMADQLTEGLPEHFKSHFYTVRVKDTLEWLSIATRIESDMGSRSQASQKRHIVITAQSNIAMSRLLKQRRSPLSNNMRNPFTSIRALINKIDLAHRAISVESLVRPNGTGIENARIV